DVLRNAAVHGVPADDEDAWRLLPGGEGRPVPGVLAVRTKNPGQPFLGERGVLLLEGALPLAERVDRGHYEDAGHAAKVQQTHGLDAGHGLTGTEAGGVDAASGQDAPRLLLVGTQGLHARFSRGVTGR